MDQGPFRMPRQAEGNPTNEPAETPKPAPRPKPIEEEKKPVHRSSTHHLNTEEKSRKPLLIAIAAVIAFIIIALGIWALVSNLSKSGTAIDGNKYQAVFFTNGQVYFGKLNPVNDEYMKLTDVYYLQTQAEDSDSKNPQQTSSDQSNPTLIKLGDEIHGPEDEMIISKEQVLFYENLKADGTVSKSIAKAKESK